MAERSEALKKWDKRMSDMENAPDRDYTQGLFPIYQIIDKFEQTIDLIEFDFTQTHHGKSEDDYRVTQKNGTLISKKVPVFNPTNRRKISKETLQDVNSVLDNAREIAQYPLHVADHFFYNNETHAAQLMYPKLQESLISCIDGTKLPFEGLIDSVAQSLIINKTLDLREDYPGRLALRQFDREIDRILTNNRSKR